MKRSLSTLTESQKKAIEAFESGRNVFLSGEAGTGKSFVLNHYLASIYGRKNVMVCAPTGIAALNVDGVTMHRAFRIPLHPLGPSVTPDEVSRELLNADVVVIDEISMARFDVFQYAAESIRMAEAESGKKKQLILIGDFFQLPPVITNKDRDALEILWGKDRVKDGFAFQAPLWNSFDFMNIILTESMRQRDDQDFLDNLNRIRKGDADAISWINSHASESEVSGIKMCPTNREVDRINELESDKLSGDYVTFKSKVYGKVLKSEKPSPDILLLKPGQQVMTVANDPAGIYRNGTLGIIQDINKDGNSVIVEFPDGRSSKIEARTWFIQDYSINEDGELETKTVGTYIQLPLKVAYAITIHKSQGKTFDSVTLNPQCFAAGQLYVAISRLTSIAGLYLSKKITAKNLLTSKAVIEFYKNVA